MRVKISEYAKLKNVTTRTVWNWINKGYVKVEKSESGLNQIITDEEDGVFEYTSEMVEEITKCQNDIIYFAEKYVNISCIDYGEILIELYPKQKDVLLKMVNSQHLIVNGTRQWGGSMMNIIYLLWTSIFKSNTYSCYFSTKAESAKMVKNKFEFVYNRIPNWMKARIVKNTKNFIKFDNGSIVFIKKYDKNTLRGMNFNLVLFDDASFINNLRKDILVPVLCLRSCKVFLTGTLKKCPIIESEAWVYDMYRSSVLGGGVWDTIKIDWWDVPYRNEEWKRHMINAIGEDCWNEEFETDVVER